MRRSLLLKEALKGLTAARNQELIQYQKEIKALRGGYRHEFACHLTKSEAAEKKRHQLVAKRDTLWSNYLVNLKSGLRKPESSINRDRHRCRPIVKHVKTAEMRQQGEEGLSKALGYHQIARRRWISLLGQQIEANNGFVTRANLDARIREAIAKPTNYNIRPEVMAEQLESLKRNFSRTRVPKDQKLYAVVPISS